MATKSPFHAAAQLNAARGTPMPAWTPYLALYLGDPAAGGFEVSAPGNYARPPVTLSAPVNNLSSNTNTLAFAAPTVDWGEITHLVLTDALTGGNWRIAYEAAGSSLQRTVLAGGAPVVIGIGSLVYGEP